MSVGALWLSNTETDPRKQNSVINQLLEGRSNAVGTVTLTTGATSTSVTAPACGPSSVPFIMPRTANAANALATSFVKSTDVYASRFVITHASSSTTDRTFGWIALG